MDLEWDELVLFLSEVRPTALEKNVLPGWIPAHLENQARRNPTMVSVLVLDFDGDKENPGNNAGLWQKTRENLDGLEYFYHSTYSYSPAAPRFRVVIRLSRAVPAHQWREFYTAALGLVAGAAGDTKTKDPGRLYYMPLCPQDGPQPVSGHCPGVPLDVDLIRDHAAAKNATPTKKKSADEADLRRCLPKANTVLGEFEAKGAETLRRMLDHERPYAEPGERDDSLFACAAYLSRRCPHLSPESIGQFFAAEIDWAYPGDHSAPNSAIFEAKLHRAWEQVADQLRGEDPIRMAQLSRTGPYTDLELDQYVVEQKAASRAHLAAQLIVAHKGDLYCFTNGDYVHAGGMDTADFYVRHRLALATTMGVVLKEMTTKGIVDKSMKALLRDHGVPVRNVFPRFDIRTSFIDHKTETLQHAICPRRLDLIPAFDPEVDAWLRSWGDETLLDWLATAPKLEKATAALFLHGEPKTGKTMLAIALGAIWGAAPTDLGSLGVNFNGDLTNNPIILADETLPIEYKQDSGLLRRLITATSVKLKRKYMNEVTLGGAVRVVIAKNNLSLFQGETMSKEDVNAVCERLLYYKMPREKAPWLKPVPFAQHILWLEENRTVQSSDRLWVEGRDSALHRFMRVSSKARSLVCQWLMNFLMNPTPLQHVARTMFRLGTDFEINPRIIYDAWDQYLNREKCPGLNTICSVIAELGTEKVRGLYSVSLEDLSHWGQAHSYPYSVAELQLLLEQSAEKIQKRAN
jgi:hypothetical protein